MLPSMRRGLTIFAGGFVAGAIVVWAFTGFRGNSSSRRPDVPAEPERLSPSLVPQPERAKQGELPVNTPAPVDQGPPALPLQANASNVTDTAQTILIQHLHPRLQAALKQYPALDNTEGRTTLADDVANLVDDDVPIREVVDALGVMFHQERSTEVKIDILNDLLNLDDPSSYQLIVQGADPNQPQEVRKAAVSVLEDYDDTWAVPTLQQLVSDGDPEIRQAAQEALGQKTNQTAHAFPILH